MKCPNCNSTQFYGTEIKKRCQKCGYIFDKTKQAQLINFKEIKKNE